MNDPIDDYIGMNTEGLDEDVCGECGASKPPYGPCLRCAPPVMFQPEWLESDRDDGGPDIVPQPHERRG